MSVTHRPYRRIDLVGLRFGLLTVLSPVEREGEKFSDWLCHCACGKECSKPSVCLRDGRATHCGCVRKVAGLLKAEFSAEYKSWQSLRGRCLNPKDDHFEQYGGAGITVCERWAGRNSFVLFLADMGPKPSPECTVDRKENSLGYSPENCRWATPLQQGNNRRNNIRVTIDGVTKTVAQWARHKGIQPSVVNKRRRRGWDSVRAISEPPQKKRRGGVPLV